jgi:hypothetical protein
MSKAQSNAVSNTVEDDDDHFLTEDPEIPSQKIVLVSFLSPEKILANKDVYMFKNFIKDYPISWRTTRLEAWLAQQVSDVNTKLESLAGTLEKQDLSGAAVDVRSHLLRVDRLVENFQEFVRKSQSEIKETDIQEAYEDFSFKNGPALEDEFYRLNDFHTTIRGIKVRGVFASEAEAAARGKRLQKADPYVHIYQGAVGKWMAWDPDPNRIHTSEYANDQLNTLMQKYRENEESRETFYNEMKKRRMGASKTRASGEATLTEDKPMTLTETPFGAGASSTSGAYDSMFSGPADLAIQRKTEAKEVAKKEE